jgi:REP-associated tyrosine transposase
MGRKRPPRIRGFPYVGRHRYFLTICVERRRKSFADTLLAQWVSTKFVHCAGVHDMGVVAYCVMPDHLHGLVEGLEQSSDCRRFVASFKQHTGYEYRRVAAQPLWQEGYYDHVLRDDESLPAIAAYILNNPLRAGLCTSIGEYPHMGSDRYTIADLIDVVQCPPQLYRRRGFSRP